MQTCTSKMLDSAKSIDDSVAKNIDLSQCCDTESLLLSKLWNEADDDDVMALLRQRVSNAVSSEVSSAVKSGQLFIFSVHFIPRAGGNIVSFQNVFIFSEAFNIDRDML